MSFLSHTLTIAAKDLRAEMRSKEAVNASFSFSIVILLLLSFAFEPDTETVREISGGLLWIVFAFAGALILNRSFARELPNDCLDALIAAPLPASALFLGKALSNLLLLLAIEAVCFPVFGLFYNVRWTQQIGPLAGVVALGTWGFTVIGTMFSALTVNIKLREVMLPLLVYPIMIPCLMAAMKLSAHLIAGEPLNADVMLWLKFLIGFDVIFTCLALILVDIVLVG
jgi:heme exporter protein B